MTQISAGSNRIFFLGVIALALGACGGSGSGGSGSGGKGGVSSAGAPTGGGSGGTASASSAVSSGGGSSGGASSAGGRSSQPMTGGSSGPGGSSATGGSTTTVEGGRTAQSTGQGGGSGGTNRVGGTASTGTDGQGGSTGVGGTDGGTGSLSTAAGGTSTTGGTSPTGGRGGSAGSTGSGGATASGGTAAVSCPSTALAVGDSTRTIQSGGSKRTYVLHVPTGYTGSKAVPLLVDFHPHGSTGPDWRKSSPYLKLADADGVISTFPSGIGDWNVGPCCADGVDDVGFAKDMIKEIKGLACIDGKRVYAAGFSMGGGMTNYVACHAADVFAAFAPAAFDLLQEIVTDCKPGRPITVAAFRGTADPYVPYAGGLSNLVKPINFLGAVASMKKWAEWNGCTGSAADIGNGCQGYAASQCQGEEVVLCTKQGGGHEAADASLTWPVLKRHSLP
jgi:polyhydroxybutyrate depolymerase